MIRKINILHVIGFLIFMGLASAISSLFSERTHDVTLVAIVLVGMVFIVAVVVESFQSDDALKQQAASVQTVTPLISAKEMERV
jgi:hypothetical protein